MLYSETLNERIRPNGRTKLRWLDKMKADLKEVYADIGDTQERVKWRGKIEVLNAIPKPRGTVNKQQGIQADLAAMRVMI